MSVMYCEYCHSYIDTDFNVDHFTDEDGNESDKCIEEQEDDK
tara:strand:- start:6355 stop:6480 length:126 start_codon:yes stop_codon:yes gene_type:complete